MYGVRKVGKKKTDFENLGSIWDSLNSVGKIYDIRRAWTLKRLVGCMKDFTQATTVEQLYINESHWD
jgi:hypothetical protein